MRSLIIEAGLGDRILVESAGTGGWHVGQPADPRSLGELSRRGYDGSSHRAQQFAASDFSRLDLVVAMDEGHHAELLELAETDADRRKVVLLGSFSPQHADDPGVPDPYYGGPSGFRDVADRIEAGCRGLLNFLR